MQCLSVVYAGTLAVDGGLQMSRQLRNCTVSNCSILDGTYVVDCRLLSRVVVGDGCVLSGCGDCITYSVECLDALIALLAITLVSWPHYLGPTNAQRNYDVDC